MLDWLRIRSAGGAVSKAQASTQRQPETQEPSTPQTPHPPESQSISRWSSPILPYACYAAPDFLIGAGMVILQPGTGKVVVVQDTATDSWFLPKGRKDIGESIEQAALREAYEEVR